MMKLTVFLICCLSGTVMHFLFKPLGSPKLLAPFLPVSASPWEHYKMAFWPLCAGMVYLGLKLGMGAPAILCACFCAAFHAGCTMFGIFFFYVSALETGRYILWLDIASYFLTMTLGFRIGLRALYSQPGRILGGLAALGLWALMHMLIRFTFRPPNRPLFQLGNR